MDEQNSERFLICTIPSVRNVIEKNYRSDDCRSRSEYVSKAMKYYSGQLATKEKLCINSVVSRINSLLTPVSRFQKRIATVHEN